MFYAEGSGGGARRTSRTAHMRIRTLGRETSADAGTIAYFMQTYVLMRLLVAVPSRQRERSDAVSATVPARWIRPIGYSSHVAK